MVRKLGRIEYFTRWRSRVHAFFPDFRNIGVPRPASQSLVQWSRDELTALTKDTWHQVRARVEVSGDSEVALILSGKSPSGRSPVGYVVDGCSEWDALVAELGPLRGPFDGILDGGYEDVVIIGDCAVWAMGFADGPEDGQLQLLVAEE